MVNIIKQEIEMETALKNKIEFICSFCNTTPIIYNRSIRTIEHTNLTYVEPHRVIIKGITYLTFNYEPNVYIKNLSKCIPIKALEEYKQETTIIENNIKELERQILESEQVKDLKFTKEDILIKRDIDFINKIKLPNLYNQIVITWKDLSREQKGKIIMNYIEDITLKFDVDGEYIVDTVNFRSTFFKDFKSLDDEGYIDWKFVRLDTTGIGYVRFSNYIPQDKLYEHIMRLREYYDVHYYEGILDFETGMFNTKKEDNDEVVRIFPIEKFDTSKTKINMGMIGASKGSETRVLNEEELFSQYHQMTLYVMNIFLKKIIRRKYICIYNFSF